tara:strand:- start:2562 stop:2741 length:180 start_codon:yes stop_codon:yes gene_type:complete
MKIIVYCIILAPILIVAIPFLTSYLFFDRYLDHRELKKGYKKPEKDIKKFTVNSWAIDS